VIIKAIIIIYIYICKKNENEEKKFNSTLKRQTKNEEKRPHPWDTHYQFSIKTPLSNNLRYRGFQKRRNFSPQLFLPTKQRMHIRPWLWATARTVKVITVHWGSVGCLQPTPSSEWFLTGLHLISLFTLWAACSPHLLLSDSSKPAPYFTLFPGDSSKPAPYFTVLSVPYFTVLSVKCNWSRIQSKKSCTHQDSVKKILPAAQFVS